MARLLERTIEVIYPQEKEAMGKARLRQRLLTKPRGSLGRLEQLSVKIAGITGKATPCIEQKAIVTMAGDHGVVAEGVSAYPQEVTAQMVYNFLRGGAGINVLARHIGARVVVVDMGVAANLEPHPLLISKKIAFGTSNMAKGPAMSKEQALRTIERGIELINEEVTKGLDIVGVGDMGIGNTTPSSAICAVVTGEPVAEVTGRGTGIGDKQLASKVKTIEASLAFNKPDPSDAIDVLSKVGGFEIGGIAGTILGAAAQRIPVVLDGFIAGAAALIATRLCPTVMEYLIAAHVSTEVGHKVILDYLGLKPLLNLEMRLGEGTGAAMGIFTIEAAVKTLVEMATFADAGVSEELD
jgi:nicotinate-nucleotide--dimethylbenzimidazole phosphoribosyltransferase